MFKYINKRGFSLVEVMVAIVLVMAVSLSMISLIGQSAVFSKRLDFEYAASNIAQQRIDTIKTLNFSDLPASEEVDSPVDLSGNIVEGESEYLRTTLVETAYDNNQSLARIKVSVKRSEVDLTGRTGDPREGRELVLETLIADL